MTAAPVAPRLLVVDDEPAILASTCRYLRSLGYEVDGAREREEAEALLVTGDYGLLIVDMRMTPAHGREGLELLRELQERHPAARAIVVTAHGSIELEAEARRRGASVFLQKPVSLAVIANAAAALLEGLA